MSNTVNIGRCEVCGKEDVVLRSTRFHYNIPCDCHVNNHFDLIQHCENCVPKRPEFTKVFLKTENLKMWGGKVNE